MWQLNFDIVLTTCLWLLLKLANQINYRQRPGWQVTYSLLRYPKRLFFVERGAQGVVGSLRPSHHTRLRYFPLFYKMRWSLEARLCSLYDIWKLRLLKLVHCDLPVGTDSTSYQKDGNKLSSVWAMAFHVIVSISSMFAHTFLIDSRSPAGLSIVHWSSRPLLQK